jgi:uncharacterized protein YjbI with pentapeptide repeats
MTPNERKLLRARWSGDVLRALNAELIHSTPKRPVLPMEELASRFEAHDVGGVRYLDLRGLELYELRNVRWDRVDLSAVRMVKGVMAPGLVGTGSIGNIASELTSCLLVEIDAADANLEGRYRDCDFLRARLRRMSFAPRSRLLRCSLAQADLTRSRIGAEVTFTACSFAGASFVGADLGRAVFEDCDFSGARFDDAAIMGTRFVRCLMDRATGENVILERPVYEDTVAPTLEARRGRRP